MVTGSPPLAVSILTRWSDHLSGSLVLKSADLLFPCSLDGCRTFRSKYKEEASRPLAVSFLYPPAQHQEHNGKEHLDLSEDSRVVLLFPFVSEFNEEKLGFGR